jgi:hypothetical protein
MLHDFSAVEDYGVSLLGQRWFQCYTIPSHWAAGEASRNMASAWQLLTFLVIGCPYLATFMVEISVYSAAAGLKVLPRRSGPLQRLLTVIASKTISIL